MGELFGFSITRLKKQSDPKQSFTVRLHDDGTQTIAFWPLFPASTLIWKVLAKTE